MFEVAVEMLCTALPLCRAEAHWVLEGTSVAAVCTPPLLLRASMITPTNHVAATIQANFKIISEL